MSTRAAARRVTPCRSPYAEGERGQALIEMAVAMPIMLMLISAIVDGAWTLHQAGLVSAAAEAAQRAVAVQDTGAGNCTGDPPAAYASASLAAARAAAPTLDLSRMTIGLRYLEPACNGRMRTLIVDVKYALSAVTPWFAGLLNGRPVAAEAGSAVEEIPPSWWGSAAQADQTRLSADQAQIASQQSQLASQQSQLASQQGQLASQQGQLASQQAEIASLSGVAAQVQQDQASLAADQSEIASLASAYQSALSAYQSVSSAYQAEVSLASSLARSAAYYYAQWQNLATQGIRDGIGGQ